MKRALSLLLTLMLIFAMGMSASAEGASVSLTTGLPTDKEYKPVTMIMDNEAKARPQKGISEADVVYEMETYNGGYTRYIAIFNDTIPHLVEAIRSARICSVDVSMDWGGAFIHYGGQSYEGRNVFTYMNQIGMDAHFDGMNYGAFKRDSARKKPNNVYVYLDEFLAEPERAFTVANPRSPFQFSAEAPSIRGNDVTHIDLAYRGDSYHPSFDYVDGLYMRSYNGSAHVDGDTGVQLSYSNVLVQRVNTSWYNGMSDAPVVDVIGSGVCEFFIGGKHFTGSWSRSDVNSSTQYFDDEGNPVYLMPGKTFVELAKDKVELVYS